MKRIKIEKTEVTAAICPNCNHAIFSRATHDMLGCKCESIFIDGGFDYVKTSYKCVRPKLIKLYIPVSKKTLYDDWNLRRDKFGIIKPNEIKDFESP